MSRSQENRASIRVGDKFTVEETGQVVFGIEHAGCSGCYGTHTSCDNLPTCTSGFTPEGVQMKFIKIEDRTAYVAAVLEGPQAVEDLFDEFDNRES